MRRIGDGALTAHPGPAGEEKRAAQRPKANEGGREEERRSRGTARRTGRLRG
jgi:hypothetical protein